MQQLESKRTVVRWTEEEWDRLAELVHPMRRNSPDSIATLANRAPKQFPQDRQRPGILTTAALQPLIERVQEMDRDLQVKADKCDEYAAKLTFFEDAPATKEELLNSLTDEEIVQRFLPRVLQVMAPADLVGSFRPEQLFASVSMADLAAATARRFVMDLERPIQVTVQVPEAREARHPVPAPKANGRKRRILIVGISNGDQRRIVNDSVGHLCDLRFLDGNSLRRDMIPTSVDGVIVWVKTMSHKSWEMVRSAYPPRMISEHHGGIEQMIHQVEQLAGAVK